MGAWEREALPSWTEKGCLPVWEALVEEWPDAAPVRQLITALRAQEYDVFESRDQAAREAVRWSWPLLRVTPHLNDDLYGFRSVHAAYSLAYSVPVLCRYPDELCVLPVHDLEMLRRACARCFPRDGGQEGRISGRLPVAWKDVTPPQTLRAEAVPPEELHERTQQAESWRMPPPEPYRWREFCDDLYEWEKANPAPALSAAEVLGMAGVERYVKQCELAAIDDRIRVLLRQAHEEGLGPTRLQALSGVSRRTIPGWLRADA